MNNNHIKKATALLLAIFLLFSCTVTGASALESDITVPSWATYSQQYPEAYRAIVMGIENMQTEINLENANVPNKSIDGQALISYIYQEVLDENPQLFYVDISQGYSYSASYKNVIKLYLSYTSDNTAIDEMKREFESLSQKYLSLISDEMTDYEKALVIHDAIALNCKYDETYGNAPNAFDAYGVFGNGVAVCQGYAYAYKYLLDRLGIECHIVSSQSMNHAWNIVKIDNSYYHVDVTWDDPISDKLGRVEHTYFLLSDEEIQSGNKPHTGYGINHPATSDRFDSYFWKKVSSAFNYNNGDWYYTDTLGNIYKGTTENMQETVLLTVTDKWYVGNSGRYYIDKFTKTALHNGYLYYNTPDDVKRISLQGSQGEQIVYTNTDNSAHLFAIAKKLDDVMYASLLSDYNGFDNVIILFDLTKEETQPSVETTTEPTEPTTTIPITEPTEPTTTVPVTEHTEPTTTVPVTEPTTEPTTTAPVTEPTEPTTTVPVTEPTEPTTTVPVTEPTEPTTTVPVTDPTEPTTTVPVTDPTEPTTTAPVTEPTEPATTAPVTDPTTEPTTTVPVTEPTEPTTTAPVTEPTEPTTTAPVTDPTEPTTTAPVTEPTEPTTTAPVTEPTEPTTTAPVTEPTEPATTAPVTEPTKPATTAPVTKPTEPTTTVPVTKPTEPTTVAPATDPTTDVPTTEPTTDVPTTKPTTVVPTTEPTTAEPTTESTEPTTVVVTDKDTNVSVEGEIPQDAQLNVEKAVVPIANAVVSYSISLEKDGVKVEFGTTVIVKLPVPENADETLLKVFKVANDQLIKVQATLVNGFLEFETDEAAVYTIVEGEPKKILIGDVDGDGKIKINDVTIIQKSAAYIITLTEEQLQAADVNKDGKVNVNDATTIQKIIAGLTQSL